MDLAIRDKVFLVTGASAGIGEATARLLAAEGAFVVGVSRKPDTLADLGPRVSGLAADLTEPEAAGRIVAAVLEGHGRLDGVVGNLGAVRSGAGFRSLEDRSWRESFEVNLFAGLRVLRAALPALLVHGGALRQI